jgi:hypothetical protein
MKSDVQIEGYDMTNQGLTQTKTPWPESESELYRLSGRRLSAQLVPTFVDRGCHVGTVTDPYGRILAFLDQSRYFFFQVAPQLYSRGVSRVANVLADGLSDRTTSHSPLVFTSPNYL